MIRFWELMAFFKDDKDCKDVGRLGGILDGDFQVFVAFVWENHRFPVSCCSLLFMAHAPMGPCWES